MASASVGRPYRCEARGRLAPGGIPTEPAARTPTSHHHGTSTGTRLLSKNQNDASTYIGWGGSVTLDLALPFDRLALPRVFVPQRSLPPPWHAALFHSGRSLRIAVAPAGDIGRRFASSLERAGHLVRLFDREARLTPVGESRPYIELRAFEPDVILVAAASAGDAVRDACLVHRPPNVEVIELIGEPSTRWTTLGLLSDELACSAVSDDDLRAFERWRAGRRVVVVHAFSHFADLVERRAALEGAGDAVLELESPLIAPFDVGRGAVRLDAYLALRRGGADQGDVLYAVLNLLGHAALAAVRLAAPDLPVVAYAYDWLHMMCPPESRHLRERLVPIPVAQLDTEFACEARTGRGENADLLLVKDDARRIPGLDGPTGSWREFRAIPLADDVDLPPVSPPGAPPRFVYLGSIVSPREQSNEFFGDAFLAPVVRRVAEQGFPVSMFYGRSEHAAAAELREDLGSTTLVSIAPGGRVTALLEENRLVGDIGWMLSDSEFEHQVPHARGSLPSKIFAYAAAGLAIAISDRCHGVAELITREGIGFTVPRERLDDLASLLSALDIQAMKVRSRAFFHRAIYEHGCTAFVEVIGDVARRRGRRKTTDAFCDTSSNGFAP